MSVLHHICCSLLKLCFVLEQNQTIAVIVNCTLIFLTNFSLGYLIGLNSHARLEAFAIQITKLWFSWLTPICARFV